MYSDLVLVAEVSYLAVGVVMLTVVEREERRKVFPVAILLITNMVCNTAT